MKTHVSKYLVHEALSFRHNTPILLLAQRTGEEVVHFSAKPKNEPHSPIYASEASA
ncbi:MAG: hypothetical protein U5L45_25275 [Saprospiraceae bacterium]|nr:hypothetical protein [Saprospiraceae bacterium]